MLWRRKDVTLGILLVTLAAWVVFVKSGYTLLSLVSSVFLLLIVILYLWTKSAEVLNRPPPPLPNLQISEEVVNEIAAVVCSQMNNFLSISRDFAMGKDSKMFLKIAAFLWLISVVGSWTDFLTFGYTSLAIILTVPALYEKYEDQIDGYIVMGYRELRRLFLKLDDEILSMIRRSI